MNKNTKTILLILLVLFGTAFFVYGGYDDSPGAQLLGVLVVIGGIVGIIKNKKNKNL